MATTNAITFRIRTFLVLGLVVSLLHLPFLGPLAEAAADPEPCHAAADCMHCADTSTVTAPSPESLHACDSDLSCCSLCCSVLPVSVMTGRNIHTFLLLTDTMAFQDFYPPLDVKPPRSPHND